jgi:hypothetical protein
MTRSRDRNATVVFGENETLTDGAETIFCEGSWATWRAESDG